LYLCAVLYRLATKASAKCELVLLTPLDGYSLSNKTNKPILDGSLVALSETTTARQRCELRKPNNNMPLTVLIRGGGDLASGVALRLHRCGLRIIVSELPRPLAVRRRVSFAEAVYSGKITVESVTARSVSAPADKRQVMNIIAQGEIPVLIDPHGDAVQSFQPEVIVDARMLKQYVEFDLNRVRLLVGLGPGFVAGDNCHAVIETNRGISMGRVTWQGPAENNTFLPEAVAERQAERVLRAPADGVMEAYAEIGDHLESGQIIAQVAGESVKAAFKGVLRGMIHPGLRVSKGLKIGDLDPRDNPQLCVQVSDKSLAVGGGALEAILSRHDLRSHLWE
jgi:xanthine dehydrogenase accessory factor